MAVRRLAKWLCAALVVVLLGVGWRLLNPPPLRHPPGILAPADPVQGPLERARVWRLEGYGIRAVATYDVTARILHRRRYRFDREADLARVDLLLGWARMSDQDIVDRLRFRQSGRWGYWNCDDLPIPENDINQHSANTHIIALDTAVHQQILDLRAGELVRLQGFLVDVLHKDGWRWESSRQRTDSGKGACELLLVETVKRVGVPVPAKSGEKAPGVP